MGPCRNSIVTHCIDLISLQHLEESQISGRKRFIALRKDQMEKVAQQEFEQHLETFDEVLLPENHPYYDRVAKVAARILDSNTEYEEIRTKKWTISVVDQKDQNAFVLPSGNIFVFTGINLYNYFESVSKKSC